MPTPRILAALAISSSLLTASSAEATLARAVTFEEKVQGAEAIILGRCVTTKSEWDPSKRWIITRSTFKIEEAIKGDAPPEITLTTPGGTVDGVHQQSVGVRPFKEGEEHVVFVKNTPVGPTVLFFDQGAYDVTRDESGERMVMPVATGAVLIDTQRGMAVAAEEPRTLKRFKGQVRDAMSRGPKQMDVVPNKARPSVSLKEALLRHKALLALALIGAILSTWRMLRH